MTMMVSPISQPMLDCEDWNCWALPWKLARTPLGSRVRVSRVISSRAGPSTTPVLRLKEMVTAGNWPAWFTDNGPTSWRWRVTACSGTSLPWSERTSTKASVEGSVWYRGSSSMITLYWSLAAKMSDTLRVP